MEAYARVGAYFAKIFLGGGLFKGESLCEDLRYIDMVFFQHGTLSFLIILLC